MFKLVKNCRLTPIFPYSAFTPRWAWFNDDKMNSGSKPYKGIWKPWLEAGEGGRTSWSLINLRSRARKYSWLSEHDWMFHPLF